MIVNIQVQVDLAEDSRTWANVEAAVHDATQAAMDRLGVHPQAHEVRARVETVRDTAGERISVRKDVVSWGGGF